MSLVPTTNANSELPLVPVNTEGAAPLCLYRGRPCTEPRDRKRNGDLHRFCRTHRVRFNQYQRDSLERRRGRERAMAVATAKPSIATPVDPTPRDDLWDDEIIRWLYDVFDCEEASAEYLLIDLDDLDALELNLE